MLEEEHISTDFNENLFHQIDSSTDVVFNMGISNEGPGLPPVYIGIDNSPQIKKLYARIANLIELNSTPFEIIKKTFDEVSKHFVFRSVKEVDNVVKRKTEERISLEKFVEKRAGTCFQTTLTTCLLLEELNQQKLIKDKPLMGLLNGDRFSHVWCITQIDNERYVLDIVSDFLGTEEEYKKRVVSELAESAFD